MLQINTDHPHPFHGRPLEFTSPSLGETLLLTGADKQQQVQFPSKQLILRIAQVVSVIPGFHSRLLRSNLAFFDHGSRSLLPSSPSSTLSRRIDR